MGGSGVVDIAVWSESGSGARPGGLGQVGLWAATAETRPGGGGGSWTDGCAQLILTAGGTFSAVRGSTTPHTARSHPRNALTAIRISLLHLLLDAFYTRNGSYTLTNSDITLASHTVHTPLTKSTGKSILVQQIQGALLGSHQQHQCPQISESGRKHYMRL